MVDELLQKYGIQNACKDMTQDERWIVRFNEVIEFLKRNHKNPSRHRIEEHGMLNWLKANRKVLNAGNMKPERVKKLTIVDFRHDSTMIKRAYHCARCSESLENF